MHRIRILISTGIFPNRVRGNRGVYNLKLALALREYCELRVVAPVPYLPGFVRSGAYTAYAAVPRRDVIEGFDVLYPRYFVTPKVFRSTHGFTLYASVVGKYRRIVAEFQPDLILGFFAYPYGFANVLLGRTFRLPVVTSCRGSDIHSIAQNFLQGRLIAWALRRCARVFSVSGALKRDIVALGVDPEHISVISNGIEPDRFTTMGKIEARRRLGIPEAGRVAVCVSRLSPEKGVDVLVESAPYLHGSDVRIVIVGDGPQQHELERRARELGVSDRIMFAGDRPHGEVPFWVCAGDVFVLPSRKEGYPNAVVEALACGRPVVAARVGGVPEIVTGEDLGFLVAPEQPQELARALDRSLEKEWDHQYIAACGRKRDWNTVAQEMLREFERILGRTPFGPAGTSAGADEPVSGAAALHKWGQS